LEKDAENEKLQAEAEIKEKLAEEIAVKMGTGSPEQEKKKKKKNNKKKR